MNKPTNTQPRAALPEPNPNREIELHPRGNRTSEVQLDGRIRQVEKLLLRGSSYSDLVTFCDGTFGVSERTAERYIAEAYRRIRLAHEKDRELDIAIAKARYEEIIRLAIERMELAVAVSAQRNIDRLLGLDAPERVEHGASDSLTEFFKKLRGGGDTGH